MPREGFEPSTSGFRSRRSDVELTRQEGSATYVAVFDVSFITFVIMPINITDLGEDVNMFLKNVFLPFR